MPGAKAISLARVSCCMCYPKLLNLSSPMSPLPPFSPCSSASTVVRRCSSSRPSHAGNRFVLHPHSEPQHDLYAVLLQRFVHSSSERGDNALLCPAPQCYRFRRYSSARIRCRGTSVEHHSAPSVQTDGQMAAYNRAASTQIPIACLAAPRHPAVSSLEACPTPARGVPSFHRAPLAQGRHQTTLNSRRPRRHRHVFCDRNGRMPTITNGCSRLSGELRFTTPSRRPRTSASG